MYDPLDPEITPIPPAHTRYSQELEEGLGSWFTPPSLLPHPRQAITASEWLPWPEKQRMKTQVACLLSSVPKLGQLCTIKI